MVEKIRSRYKTYTREEVTEAFASDSQESHPAWYPTKMMLQERLDVIWRLGDRDEVSIKHIMYSIGAILAGRRWNEQLAYGTEEGMNQKPKVKRSWAIVETMLEHWGLDNFAKVFYATKFGQTGYSEGEKDPLDAYWSYGQSISSEGPLEYPLPSRDDDTPAARAYYSEEVKQRRKEKFEEMKAKMKRNPPKQGPRGED